MPQPRSGTRQAFQRNAGFGFGVILAVLLFASGAHAAALTGPEWTAGPGSPPALAAEDGGVVFRCPFTSETDRFFWDQDVNLDLSRASSFTLDLGCDRPSALRMLSVYFRSGDGWYHWSGPAPAGRARLTLVKSRFAVEGRPAGWNRIDRVRISPWRGEPEPVRLTLHGLTARRDTLLVVQGTLSAPSASEKTSARLAAERVSRWLTGLGIEHGGTDDEAVANGALSGTRLAILAYNPQPPAAMLAALRTFVANGGKLIVFGSTSSELARLMGLRLGTYTVSHEPGRWAAIRFSQPDYWHTPSRVHETAWGLTPAYPVADGARVIARWEAADGTATADPACLAAPHGFWFCHYPRSEDPRGKQAMLLALAARADPSLWRAAARHVLANAGRIGPHADLPAAFAAIRAAVTPGRRGEAERHLDEAAARHRALSAAFADGRYAEVVAGEAELERALGRAFALTVPAPQNEFRGVWDHDAVGLYPGNWDRTCRELKAAGLTAILPNLAWGGLAHYPSRVLPTSNTLKLHGDQAQQVVEAAHRHGLEVHAWKVCWNLVNAPAEFKDRLRREERLQRTAAGVATDWLCPSHPANRRIEIDALKELVEQYPVDGVHLDYIRYPDANSCFCSGCRQRFEAARSVSIDAWPADVLPDGRYGEAYTAWRAEQITALVRGVREEVLPLRPAVRLSAAVFQHYPSCRESVAQDWVRWVREGLVDFVCPMNYTDSYQAFEGVVRRQVAQAGAAQRIVPGIGVLSGESQLGPADAAAQVTAARRLGAGGFVFFDLSHTLVEEILPGTGLSE